MGRQAVLRRLRKMHLTLTTFLSLDGVMQGPGGPNEDPSAGFTQGGWMVPYADEAMERFVTDWFAAADAFLLGRITYEIMAAYWPQVTDEDEVAGKLNGLPKYVVSKTLDKVTWNNSTQIKGDPVEEVIKLKSQAGRELQVHGSGKLAQALIQHDRHRGRDSRLPASRKARTRIVRPRPGVTTAELPIRKDGQEKSPREHR